MAKATADNITETTDVLEALQPTVESTPSFAPPTQSVNEPPKRTSHIFILANDKRKGTVILDVEEDVIDPSTGKVRRMRLLRGAQSVWFDEQPPTVFPPAYVQKNVLSLQFNNGKCIVPIEDGLMCQAALLSNRNTSNKNRRGNKDIYFYEWDPVAQSALAYKDEEDTVKAMGLAFTTPLAEIIPHAQYLGLQFSDEMGVPLGESAIRTGYAKLAKRDPKKFLSSIHSPTVQVAHTVRKAIEAGKIDLGRQPGTAYWTDGGFITALPQGRDAVDFLIEFAMLQGEPNAAFQNQLRALNN